MNAHHLVMGSLSDYLTGEALDDTHDERYRQRIARLLVEEKRYRRAEITPRRQLLIRAGGQRGRVVVDFIVSLAGKTGMLIKYGPGSLTTRHRPALAAARLLAPYRVPVAVVTNGEDCDILDTDSARVVARGFAALPSRGELERILAASPFDRVASKRAEMEARVLFAYEIDGACPCDTSVCRL
jgi:hypothetical protein